MNFIRPKRLVPAMTLFILAFLSAGQLPADGLIGKIGQVAKDKPAAPKLPQPAPSGKQPETRPFPVRLPTSADLPGSPERYLVDQLEQAKERLKQIREGAHVELERARHAFKEINDPQHVRELNRQRNDAIQRIAQQNEVDLEEYRRVEERFSRDMKTLEARRAAARSRLSQADKNASHVKDLADRDFEESQAGLFDEVDQERKVAELEAQLEDLAQRPAAVSPMGNLPQLGIIQRLREVLPDNPPARADVPETSPEADVAERIRRQLRNMELMEEWRQDREKAALEARENYLRIKQLRDAALKAARASHR